MPRQGHVLALHRSATVGDELLQEAEFACRDSPANTKFPRVTFLTHEISMAAQPVRIPERHPSPEARLRSILFDAADQLCAFPDPVELRVLVPAIREAYEESRLNLPLLKIQIHNMLRDLHTPGTFDVTYYANHLSQIAVRL